MATSEDPSYPSNLRREDERQGRSHGRQRIPALSEVRRQQAIAPDAPVTVPYQRVLLVELHEQLSELYVLFHRAGQEAAHELGQRDEQLAEAQEQLDRSERQVDVAQAPLTPEELLPRNPLEQGWTAETLRHRREVARVRRIKVAQEKLDSARLSLTRLRAERSAAARRHEETLATFGVRARRLIELCRRRSATYVEFLTDNHPDGRTLSPLLSLAQIPLPAWVPRAPDPAGPSAEAEEADPEAGVET